MEKVYGIPEGIHDVKTSFCAGCTHLNALKIIMESLNELGLRGKTVMTLPIGCFLNAAGTYDLDTIQCLHGRGAAVATGLTRMYPDQLTLAYQGDGDAISIGMAESFYAANRGEKMTVIVINNQIYGMTGGQMSPTTLVGQRSTTGVRKSELTGFPVRFPEILATLEAPGYVARAALYTPKHIMQAKQFMKKAIRCQEEKGLYSYIELLSFCPTNWGVQPKDCLKYAEENVLPIFPVGEFKSCF
jgi:2-oxoglutarate ferredoxin oxidoreductase subunit beta